MEKLLTVLVPTKNKLKYTRDSLSSLCHFPSEVIHDLSIIVVDNSDEMDMVVKNEILEISDCIEYYYDSVPKTIIENFNFAISLVKTKFLTIIGDDDFIDPRIVKWARFASTNKIDSIVYDYNQYYWPDLVFKKGSNIDRPGNLLIKPKNSFSPILIDVAKEIEYVANEGFLTFGNLPRVYHGLVSMEILKKIQQMTGYFAFGGAPDMSLAVAVSLQNPITFKIDTPLTIHGASPNSGGGWTAAKSHYAKFDQIKFINKSVFECWPRLLPSYWSAYTIPAGSANYVYNVLKCKFNCNYSAIHSAIAVNETCCLRYVLSAIFSNSIIGGCYFSLRLLMMLPRRVVGKTLRDLGYSRRRFLVFSSIVPTDVPLIHSSK